jgi:type IV secretion system protein VirB2
MTPTARAGILIGIAALALVMPAHAAGSGMPWEGPLDQFLQSVEGPVVKAGAVFLIVITGLTMAFGDMGGGFKKLIQVIFGISVAFGATSFFLTFFSFGGGAVLPLAVSA